MQQIEIWALIPFVLMLMSIAILPLTAKAFWHKNINKLLIAIILSIPTAIYLIKRDMGNELSHQILFDYTPFIVLLGSLFTVTSGILIKGHIRATPSNNTAILTIGYILASFIGTTGAAMLLIHLLLKINNHREHKTHTILFFIALVANCGGILSPLGDPPLFLLYLQGADFGWFFKMLPQWASLGVLLLCTYYFTDRQYYCREEKTEIIIADFRERSPIKIEGKINILYLALIILAVSFINSSYIPKIEFATSPLHIKFLRELTLTAIAIASLATTRKQIRAENHFSWDPIIEVAYIFIGIFITMTPALLFLGQNAERLGITKPWQFYYSTGLLSAFLDNSPTAIAFNAVARNIPTTSGATVAGVNELILKAIAMGAVFFGAMSYIGNGPNFMIKAIAEHEGVKMPTFFKYITSFSIKILLPTYILIQLLFLH